MICWIELLTVSSPTFTSEMFAVVHVKLGIVADAEVNVENEPPVATSELNDPVVARKLPTCALATPRLVNVPVVADRLLADNDALLNDPES